MFKACLKGTGRPFDLEDMLIFDTSLTTDNKRIYASWATFGFKAYPWCPLGGSPMVPLFCGPLNISQHGAATNQLTETHNPLR